MTDPTIGDSNPAQTRGHFLLTGALRSLLDGEPWRAEQTLAELEPAGLAGVHALAQQLADLTDPAHRCRECKAYVLPADAAQTSYPNQRWHQACLLRSGEQLAAGGSVLAAFAVKILKLREAQRATRPSRTAR